MIEPRVVAGSANIRGLALVGGLVCGMSRRIGIDTCPTPGLHTVAAWRASIAPDFAAPTEDTGSSRVQLK